MKLVYWIVLFSLYHVSFIQCAHENETNEFSPLDFGDGSHSIPFVKNVYIALDSFLKHVFADRNIIKQVTRELLCIATSLIKQSIALYLRPILEECRSVDHTCDILANDYIINLQLFGRPFDQQGLVHSALAEKKLVNVFPTPEIASEHFKRAALILSHLLVLASTSSYRTSLQSVNAAIASWMLPFSPSNPFCKNDKELDGHVIESARRMQESEERILHHINDYLLAMNGHKTILLSVDCPTGYYYAVQSIVYFVHRLFGFDLGLGQVATCPKNPMSMPKK